MLPSSPEAQANRSTLSGRKAVLCLHGCIGPCILFCYDIVCVSQQCVSQKLMHEIRRCFYISNLDHQINEDIRDKQIRLIDAEGNQAGIVSLKEAMDAAAASNMDLVKIAPQASPPVCRIMDYGKFRFEQAKKEKEAKKRQHIVEVKEVRFSPKIDVHDFEVKLKNAHRFLNDGNRVKVTVRFRGREMAHTSIGRDLLLKFSDQCEEIATMDRNPKLEGRQMTMFLAPKANKAP